MNKLTFLFLMLGFVFATIAHADTTQQADATQQWEEHFMASLMEQIESFEVPGTVVMVVRDDEIIHESAFGVVNLTSGEPMTLDTLFRVGSITKPLSAAYIARLVDADTIDWDDPVNNFVPDLPYEATFAELFSHQLGLPPTETDFLLYSDQLSPEDMFAELSRMSSIETGFSYNNTAFSSGVYASLIAQDFAPGELLEAYISEMRDVVFEPAGMTTATFADELPPNAAHPHTLNGLSGMQPLDDFHLGGTLPAGGAVASGYDLAAFASALFKSNHNESDDPFVSIEQLQALWSPAVHNAFGSPELMYGRGWGIDDRNGLPRVFHAGDIGGYASLLTLYPEENVGLIVLTNRDNNNFRLAVQTTFESVYFDLGSETADDLIAGYVEQYLAIKTQIADALTVAQVTFEHDDVAELLGDYERDWRVELRADHSLWLSHLNSTFQLVNVPGMGFVTVNGLAVGIPISFENDNLTILGAGTMAKLNGTAMPVAEVPEAELSVTLLPFESDVFVLQALRPEGWTEAAPGAFSRASSAMDATLLLIQSTTTSRNDFEQSLAPQLQVDALPQPDEQLITDSFVWDIYRVAVNAGRQAIDVSIALTTTEDGRTYIVVLQTTNDEHGALRDDVFLPVVTSVHLWSLDAVASRYSSGDVTFSSGGLTLAGTLTIPEGDGPFPAVVIVSGSGPTLRSGSLLPLADYEMYTALADQLTRNGVMVLRYDDRGVGESEGDHAAATLNDLALDAGAAIAYLHEREEADPERIGLIGHSEGGIIAPQTAVNRDDIAFLITIGGPAVNMTEVLAEQNRVLFTAIGADTTTANAIAAQFSSIQAAYIAGDDALLRQEVTRLIELQTGSTPSDTLVEQGIAQMEAVGNLGYWTYDVAQFWRQLDLPVLAVFGGKDTQVTAAQNVPAITALLGSQRTILTIDDMNHVFQAAVTGLPDEYGQLTPEPIQELVETLVDWINVH